MDSKPDSEKNVYLLFSRSDFDGDIPQAYYVIEKNNNVDPKVEEFIDYKEEGPENMAGLKDLIKDIQGAIYNTFDEWHLICSSNDTNNIKTDQHVTAKKILGASAGLILWLILLLHV